MTYPDTAPFNSRVSPATDDMAADEWFMSVARDCCAASEAPYASEASGDPNWKPHAWVVAAIKHAYQAGQIDADAKAMLLQEAMSDQHETLQSGMVKAAIMGVLETMTTEPVHKHMSSANGHPRCDIVSLAIDLDKMPTVDDRWTYEVGTVANYAMVTITRK